MKEKPSLRGKVNPSLSLQFHELATELTDCIEADPLFLFKDPDADPLLGRMADLLERLGIRKVRHECRCGFLLHAERFEETWVVDQCPNCESGNQ